jgi:hypothetical protein
MVEIVNTNRSFCFVLNGKFIKLSTGGDISDEICVLRIIKRRFPKDLQELIPYSLKNIRYVCSAQDIVNSRISKFKAQFPDIDDITSTKKEEKCLEKEKKYYRNHLKKWGKQYINTSEYLDHYLPEKTQKKWKLKLTQHSSGDILEVDYVDLISVSTLKFDEAKYEKFKLFLYNLYRFMIMLHSYHYFMVDLHGNNIGYIKSKDKFCIFDFDCISYVNIPNFMKTLLNLYTSIPMGEFPYIPPIRTEDGTLLVNKEQFMISLKKTLAIEVQTKEIRIKKVKNKYVPHIWLLFSLGSLLFYPFKYIDDGALKIFTSQHVKFIKGKKKDYPDLFAILLN